MDRNQFTNPKQALDYILGGNSTITFESSKTGQHLTYKVEAVDGSNNTRFFVKLLTGPDNSNSFSYIGMITLGNAGYWHFVTTKASRITMDSKAAKAMVYVLDLLGHDKLVPTLSIWHEGKCGRCGRKLTVPSSIETGFGPECAGILGINVSKELPDFKVVAVVGTQALGGMNND